MHGRRKARLRIFSNALTNLCGLLIFLTCAALSARAETLEANISVLSLAPPRVRVEGVRAGGTTAWSFRNAYANLSGLEERLENLSFTDADGRSVPFRKLAPGEYTTARPATKFIYQLKLDPPAVASDAAHLSWLANEHGVLMLGDLLPLPLASASVRFELPAGWTLASTEAAVEGRRFQTSEAETSVFFVGRNLRERRGRAASVEFTFATTGEWAFTDEEAAGAVKEILEQHAKTTGGAPRGRVLVTLAPFPMATGANAWSAETRGRAVFLLSGRQPSPTAALSQLNVPLTHELFHLWIPNALALEGEYDWFYEGFTSYQAVRAGMRLGYFSFQDYLNALGRAYDNYTATRGPQEPSLPDASKRRWTGATTLIYNKGMLVAALYDLTLRLQTSGKRSLDDVYRELFRRYPTTAAKRDGNDAVIEILRGTQATQDIVNRYVLGTSGIDLSSALAPFGLQLEQGGVRTHITMAASPSRAQRDLLRGLGYNENAGRRWTKRQK